MLKEGQPVPSFTLIDDHGQKIDSKSLKGKRYVLYFYPKDDTPGCTREACEFKDLYKQFQKNGVEVYGISKDDQESHQAFKTKYKLPFQLLTDEELELAKKFGAYGEKNMYGKKTMGVIRSTFVINEEGLIEKVYKVSKVDEHAKKVLEELKK